MGLVPTGLVLDETDDPVSLRVDDTPESRVQDLNEHMNKCYVPVVAGR